MLSLRLAIAAAVVLAVTAAPLPVAAAPARPATATTLTTNGSWPVYHHDAGHTGYDSTQPRAVTAATGWTSAIMDETVYGEPLVYQGVVYVGTLNNTVYAWNQSDGSLVWSRHLRAPQTTGWGCGGFKQGILGTPTIDPISNRIYVVTLGADSVYRAEGLNLVTGVPELTTVVTTPAPTFDRTIQQNRGALAVANGYLYVPFGGRAGDCGAYHGYVFAVPLDGTAVTHYYVTPGQGSGFWAPGGVVVDASTGKVFETSGNGTAGGCNANSNGTPVFENDAVVRLSSILGHEDAFVPADWHDNWCINDQDLGSASMVLINPTLAFQSGKWGNGFLVNPQNLGGVNGQLFPSPTNYVGVDVCHGNNSDANFGSYAYAAPYVYLSCPGHGIVALKVDTAAKTFSACDSTCGAPSWASGSGDLGPPIVAGGAVWAVDINGGGLSGFDATTGAQIFHSSAFGVNHFATPSEAGGQIFVAADREVRSFNMTSKGCPTTAGSPSAGPVRTTDLFTYGPLDGSSCVELANGSGGWAGVTGPLFASGWEFHPGHFSNSGLTDLFLYNPSTGSSYVELANGSGGWSGVAGPAFSTGWHFYPGRYSSSGLTDLFLYNPTTGTSYVELANGSGGWSGVAGPRFSTGWQFFPGRYNANGSLTDLFLYDPARGASYVEFANGSGGWSGVAGPAYSAGWEIHPGQFRSGGTLTDLFLYNPSSGMSYVEFANGVGTWSGVAGPLFSTGWRFYAGRFNAATSLTDLFLYNAGSGKSYVEFATGAGGWSGAAGPPFATGWLFYPGHYNAGSRLTDLFLYNQSDGSSYVEMASGAGAWYGVPGPRFATSLDIEPGDYDTR